MGTCTCQLHFHGDQREIINQMESPELLISNIPKDINSQLSNNSRPIKLKNINQNKIELIIKNKLSEIGHFISINEFHKYIDNGILAVMKKKSTLLAIANGVASTMENLNLYSSLLARLLNLTRCSSRNGSTTCLHQQGSA